jgi:hypothetical protein
MHRIGDYIQPIRGQVPVLVERHRGRLVAHHLLHHLDIRTGCDRQRGGRVTSDLRRTGTLDGRAQALSALTGVAGGDLSSVKLTIGLPEFRRVGTV